MTSAVTFDYSKLTPAKRDALNAVPGMGYLSGEALLKEIIKSGILTNSEILLITGQTQDTNATVSSATYTGNLRNPLGTGNVSLAGWDIDDKTTSGYISKISPTGKLSDNARALLLHLLHNESYLNGSKNPVSNHAQDADNNGRIDASEVEKFLQNLDAGITKDGKISKAEVEKWLVDNIAKSSFSTTQFGNNTAEVMKAIKEIIALYESSSTTTTGETGETGETGRTGETGGANETGRTTTPTAQLTEQERTDALAVRDAAGETQKALDDLIKGIKDKVKDGGAYSSIQAFKTKAEPNNADVIADLIKDMDMNTVDGLKTAVEALDRYLNEQNEAITTLQKEIDDLVQQRSDEEEKLAGYQKDYESAGKSIQQNTNTLEWEVKSVEKKTDGDIKAYQANMDSAVATATKKFNDQTGDNKKPLADFIAVELLTVVGVKGANLDNVGSLQSKISALDSEMGNLLTKIFESSNKIADLTSQIENKSMELNQCMANAQAASEKMSGKNEELTKKCDDPIGFIDGNGDRFDFITDRNDDGIFNGVNEFLGAQNGFDEMRGLDKDGNGIVEGNELAGLKLLKTDKSGKQSFIDASAMDIKVDLKSYQDKGGASIGKGQSLLGNFNLTVGGESIQGYNTLDSSEYLNKTYGNMFNQSLTGGSASKPANISNPFSSASSVDLNFKGIDSGAIAQSASQLLASAESTVQFGSKMAGLTLSAANAIDEKAPETKPETDKKDNGKKADKTSKVETPAVEIKTAEAPKVDILKADNSTKKPLLEEQIAA